MRQGMIHIYCGDGKGKTTAATGLAVRAAGSGMKVLFARFLKNENSAELCVLDQIPGIEVIHLPKSYGFYNTQSEEEKAETKQMYEELWKYALDRAKNGACDMLVMDEFMAADRYGLIPHEEAIQFLKEKPEGLEVVLITAAFDQDVSLVFTDDGVYQLMKGIDTKGIEVKDFSKTYRALEGYDIEKLYVDQVSMDARGLTEDDLIVDVTVLSADEMANLMAEQDVVISF